MKEQPEFGKISIDVFEKVVYPNLGAFRNEVLVGPSFGVDNCVINVGGGQVLIATTDPLSHIPELGAEDSAWLSVHSIASDICTSGFHPQYAIFDFNLPSNFGSDEFERYWNALSRECKNIGIAIVGGHTGRFEGIDSTIIGAGTMFSLGSSRAFLTASSAIKGHVAIVTKGAAIETTGILSRVFANKITQTIGGDATKLAQTYFKKISVVEDALTVTKVGLREAGVSAMHDATEGGVLSGLYELANSSSLGLTIDLEKIPVSSETVEICKLFQIDPYVSLSEGTLILSCNQLRAADVLTLLHEKGIDASIVGQLSEPNNGIKLIGKNGEQSVMSQPARDPYWDAYYRAKRLGWS
jgi:hydrogenase expression/formation protein HypE